MATPAEILSVRQNVNEPDGTTFDDAYISGLIDGNGVDSASSIIWTQKAATYSELVDVTEAGASRKMSDLYKNALDMAKYFRGRSEDEDGSADLTGRAKVHKIVRS